MDTDEYGLKFWRAPLFPLSVFHLCESVANKFMAKEIELKLQEGDAAPNFSAAASGGGTVSLADLRGKNVILYFYPKDDTPGCTKEACSFRDHFAAFRKKGAVVLGVSPDSVKKHDKFVEKFKLPFPLLADEDKKIVNDYGVWGEKMFMGRKYMGTFRVTFLIGPDGKIKKIWPDVKPDEHAAEVLAAL
jgi:peroxiredoxin Q/BCP